MLLKLKRKYYAEISKFVWGISFNKEKRNFFKNLQIKTINYGDYVVDVQSEQNKSKKKRNKIKKQEYTSISGSDEFIHTFPIIKFQQKSINSIIENKKNVNTIQD